MHKVTIIVPVYNTQEFLQDCILSITSQSHSDIELILVDDESTDNSPKICDDWSKKDARIKVIHQKNKGAAAARNAGIKVATGEFISFVDSDDTIEKDMLKHCIEKATKSCVDIVNFGYTLIYDNHKKNVTCPDFVCHAKNLDDKLFYSYFITWYAFLCVTKLYRRSFLSDNALLFHEGVILGEDSDFVMECFKSNPYIVNLSDCYYNYYKRATDNVTSAYYRNLGQEQYDSYCKKNIFFKSLGYSFSYDIDGSSIKKDIGLLEFQSLNNINLPLNLQQHYTELKSLFSDSVKKDGVISAAIKPVGRLDYLSSKISVFLIKSRFILLLTLFIRFKTYIIKKITQGINS